MPFTYEHDAIRSDAAILMWQKADQALLAGNDDTLYRVVQALHALTDLEPEQILSTLEIR